MQLTPSFLRRANRLLNLNDYTEVSAPLPVFEAEFVCPYKRQYILRMLIKNPDSAFEIPTELEWLRGAITLCHAIQMENGLKNPFVYVTVRHGLVTSETDDSWHVDGFSMRVPHTPEQNYFWTSSDPTEYQDKCFPIPWDFDPSRHNLHNFLDSRAEDKYTKQCEPEVCYAFDPYFVHRRPTFTKPTVRTFWRISFIPIEIQDDTCTRNPLLPTPLYGRQDVRKQLVNYPE